MPRNWASSHLEKLLEKQEDLRRQTAENDAKVQKWQAYTSADEEQRVDIAASALVPEVLRVLKPRGFRNEPRNSVMVSMNLYDSTHDDFNARVAEEVRRRVARAGLADVEATYQPWVAPCWEYYGPDEPGTLVVSCRNELFDKMYPQ